MDRQADTVGASAEDAIAQDPSSLASLVPHAAERWPDELALIGEIERLTWADLERRTRSIASHLIEAGIRPGDRVAIARPKGSESYEAVHAVLRAGAVVVPVDAGAPPALAAELVSDAGAVAVLGDARTVAKFDPWSILPDLRMVIASGSTDDDRVVGWNVAVADSSPVDLPVVDPDDVAYFIYTSGSTGRPKGIVHTHRSALAYARAAATTHGIRHDDCIAGMCPLHFDQSTLELYVAPLVGARVVAIGDALLRLFLPEFTELCASERVSVWHAVPYLLRQLTERGALDRFDLSGLRLILYGGEPYPPGALRELMLAVPHAEICNVYGPAETNAVTSHVIDGPPVDDDQIAIGRPWTTTQIRLIDGDGHVIDGPGTGELYLSSTSAMREYWRRPDLTGERLVHRSDGPAWYVTGDVVERDAAGVLWFRGRRDHQVKVRGVRLELGAIESVLADAPGVAYAVAGTTGPSGDASGIVAAVVASSDAELELEAVLDWCGGRLPSVAVPQTIDVWPSFPSTVSGKIDRSAVRSSLLDHEVA